MNQFIIGLKKYAKDLEKASIWQNSRKPVSLATNSAKESYIYEFYCYLRIIKDLKEHYYIEYEQGKGAWKNKFPKSPADKKDKPYFILRDDNQKPVYQVCAGTKIKTSHGKKTNAPDISFQLPNSPEDKPDHTFVKIIMDAKYVYKGDKKTTEGSLNDFIVMINNLDLKKAKQDKIWYSQFNGIEGNCLISNGPAPSNDVDYIRFHGFCELENLNENNNHKIII